MVLLKASRSSQNKENMWANLIENDRRAAIACESVSGVKPKLIWNRMNLFDKYKIYNEDWYTNKKLLSNNNCVTYPFIFKTYLQVQ